MLCAVLNIHFWKFHFRSISNCVCNLHESECIVPILHTRLHCSLQIADILTPIVCRCIQHYHTRGTRSTQDGWKTSVKRWWLASPLWTHQCQSLQSTLLPVVIATPHVLPHLLLDHPETRTRRSMLVSYQMLIYYLVGTTTSSILKIVISLNLGRLIAKVHFHNFQRAVSLIKMSLLKIRLERSPLRLPPQPNVRVCSTAWADFLLMLSIHFDLLFEVLPLFITILWNNVLFEVLPSLLLWSVIHFSFTSDLALYESYWI